MTREKRQAKARALYAGGYGLTIREIAEQLGVSVGTAHRDVNPKAAQNYRIQSRERKRHQKRELATTGENAT